MQRCIGASDRTATTARAATDRMPEPSLVAVRSPPAHRRPAILVGGLLLSLLVSAGAVAVIASAGRDQQLSGPTSPPDAQNQQAGENLPTPTELSDDTASSASSPDDTAPAVAAVASTEAEVVETATALTLSTPIVEPIHPVNPRGVAVAEDGFVVFTDDHRVVRIESDGSTRVLAGGTSPGVVKQSGGRGSSPGRHRGVFADNGSNRVMSISPSGWFRFLAGTRAEGFGGDGGQLPLPCWTCQWECRSCPTARSCGQRQLLSESPFRTADGFVAGLAFCDLGVEVAPARMLLIRTWVTAIRWIAEFSRRSPPRDSRCRCLSPLATSTCATPV